MAKKTQQEEILEFAKGSNFIFEIPPYKSNWKPIEQINYVEKTHLKPNPFEPRTFKDFVGQQSAKEVLQIIVDSANKENRLIPNILLTGAYGHGKTTLAKLVIRRHKKKIKIIDGSIAATAIVPSKEIVYIVDEAHNIPPQLADTYNLLIDSDNLRIVACTTNPGALPAAFRSRFRNIYLGSYTSDNIKIIVQRAARRSKINITGSAAQSIAERAKLNPRYALSLLDFIREISVVESTLESPINEKDVMRGLAILGIDPSGLTELDRKYLKLLHYDRPVGLQYIAAVLSTDVTTVQEEIEPYLIQAGLVERTAKGRLLGGSIEAFKARILEEAKNFIP